MGLFPGVPRLGVYKGGKGVSQLGESIEPGEWHGGDCAEERLTSQTMSKEWNRNRNTVISRERLIGIDGITSR